MSVVSLRRLLRVLIQIIISEVEMFFSPTLSLSKVPNRFLYVNHSPIHLLSLGPEKARFRVQEGV